MLTGGHMLPPGLGLDSLESEHLERCQIQHTLCGIHRFTEKVEMKLGCR